MSGLVYYLPGKSAVKREDALAAGLGYAMERKLVSAGMSSGPDGAGGAACMFADGNLAALAGAATRRGTWQQVPGSPAWVGFDPDERPAPPDLARAEQLDGHLTRLADGAEWLVPVARMFDGEPALPRSIGWDGSSWAPGDVLPQHQSLWRQACRVYDLLAEGEGAAGRMIFSEECDLAARALSCNYRLGPAEISLLGLFATGTQMAVLGALIDLPAIVELQKKTAATRGSAPGGGG